MHSTENGTGESFAINITIVVIIIININMQIKYEIIDTNKFNL